MGKGLSSELKSVPCKLVFRALTQYDRFAVFKDSLQCVNVLGDYKADTTRVKAYFISGKHIKGDSWITIPKSQLMVPVLITNYFKIILRDEKTIQSNPQRILIFDQKIKYTFTLVSNHWISSECNIFVSVAKLGIWT